MKTGYGGVALLIITLWLPMKAIEHAGNYRQGRKYQLPLFVITVIGSYTASTLPSPPILETQSGMW